MHKQNLKIGSYKMEKELDWLMEENYVFEKITIYKNH